jgi:hypothetical protein
MVAIPLCRSLTHSRTLSNPTEADYAAFGNDSSHGGRGLLVVFHRYELGKFILAPADLRCLHCAGSNNLGALARLLGNVLRLRNAHRPADLLILAISPVGNGGP